MFAFSTTTITYILVLLCVLLLIVLNYLIDNYNKNQLSQVFIITFVLFIFWVLGLILQLFCVSNYNANPLYFEYFTYIAECFLPVIFFFLALIFAKTKITFKRRYLLLFVIPVISLFMLWTNDFHHLFYEKYSTEISNTTFGNYFYVHFAYTYLLYAISLFILIKYSIKNSGFFSKQAMVILIGYIVPIIVNILGYLEIISISVYTTPICLSFTMICFIIAIFKLNVFRTTPIALQRVVDKMSDSYLIISEDYSISDFNQTFITTFNIRNSSKIRGTNFEEFMQTNNFSLDTTKIIQYIDEVKNTHKTKSMKLYIPKLNKYFKIEISSIIANKQFLGILLLFKDISQHMEDMQNLKENQSILMEKERLATLGQMIGGVAHNLKTPIMSISGATEGLEDLVKEYQKSIDDPDVTSSDHHEISEEMMQWIKKIRSYNNYMSDIISAVKGQAINMNEENQNEYFTIRELLSRVNILMRHELKEALVSINEEIKVDDNTAIYGNINSLVQVVNNLISNAIQSYEPIGSMYDVKASSSSFITGNGSEYGSSFAIGQEITDVSVSRTIELIIYEKNNSIIISVEDHGCGIPDEIKKKLFKEMITTKGHNGSGLGLFMSYSTIKGNFNGNIKFASELGKGSIFNIIIPFKNN